VNAANNDAIRPQWSPPSDGGSTRLLEVPGGAGVVAAMEPAAAWWEHSVPALAPRMLLSPPQWSHPERREHRPARGGQVHREHGLALSVEEQHVQAAMEPAAERREHTLFNGHVSEVDPAAMGPAVERREHSART